MKTSTYDETKFKLVPIEPTYEMANYVCADVGMPTYCGSQYSATPKECIDIYNQMLGEAPVHIEEVFDMTEWQTMESAPLDGTNIEILMNPKYNLVVPAYFVKEFNNWFHPSVNFIISIDSKISRWRAAGHD